MKKITSVNSIRSKLEITECDKNQIDQLENNWRIIPRTLGRKYHILAHNIQMCQSDNCIPWSLIIIK
jgi:hypothetical protein